MQAVPVNVTLRLSARQWRLLADARDRLEPSLSLAEFVARAFAETTPLEEALASPPSARTDPSRDGAGLIPPGSAAALELRCGEVVRIEQVAGGQCVDLVAWSLADARERLSAARTRAVAGISPGLGDLLWSVAPFERPLLAIVADSAPGHDLLFPACSPREYAAAGCQSEPSCVGVQTASAAAWGLEAADLPDPLNLWLRSNVAADGSLDWTSTATGPGDHVELLALVPTLVVINPCVDDIFGCSGLEPGPIRVATRQLAAAERDRWPAESSRPAAAIAGASRPLRRLADPTPGAAFCWRELTVELSERGRPASAAVVRAAAVRYSLAAVAK